MVNKSLHTVLVTIRAIEDDVMHGHPKLGLSLLKHSTHYITVLTSLFCLYKRSARVNKRQ